ncbi:P-loop NTPase family protein [Micromonospora tarensis]|uniref:ATP-binding protein n=1 Tax=Micromonospora tarensis TaxID=2806100 RepID=A0ABS1YF60_9ACTN|nr:ATP-binding protein [Micromonospora tarensis]MBM0276033.1 ATP-binding protein [Micromonospora tarensis]
MSRDHSDLPTSAGYSLTETGDAWADAPGSIAISGLVAGDVTVGLPRYRLRAVTGGTPRPAETLRLAELLDARHRVVRFLGRDEEQRSLWRWLTPGPDRPDRAVQLIHAPGGQGKTRLADQFADAARQAGWEVLRAHRDPGEPDRVVTADRRRATAGLLVLVDHGDWWPAGDLLALFTDPRLHRAGPVRVLVLARAGGYWWQALRHWLRATLGAAVGEFELAPLAPDLESRERLFRTAAARFAALVSQSRIDAVRAPDLADPAYGSALSLQLAALVAVAVSHDRTLRAPSTLVDMYGYLLDREIGHWRQLLAGDAVASPAEQLDRAVLVAMLAGPVPYYVGQAVIGCAGVGSDPGRVAQLLADHSTCYPPRNAGWVLEPLQPDRLGEAYLALALPGHGWSSYAAKPWAVGVVRELLRGSGMPSSRRRGSGPPRSRCSSRWRLAGGTWPPRCSCRPCVPTRRSPPPPAGRCSRRSSTCLIWTSGCWPGSSPSCRPGVTSTSTAWRARWWPASPRTASPRIRSRPNGPGCTSRTGAGWPMPGTARRRWSRLTGPSRPARPRWPPPPRRRRPRCSPWPCTCGRTDWPR